MMTVAGKKIAFTGRDGKALHVTVVAGSKSAYGAIGKSCDLATAVGRLIEHGHIGVTNCLIEPTNTGFSAKVSRVKRDRVCQGDGVGARLRRKTATPALEPKLYIPQKSLDEVCSIVEARK